MIVKLYKSGYVVPFMVVQCDKNEIKSDNSMVLYVENDTIVINDYSHFHIIYGLTLDEEVDILKQIDKLV